MPRHPPPSIAERMPLPEPLRVETPSPDLAEALMRRLHAFPTELAVSEQGCDVLVTLVGDPDRAVVEILNGVDGWLVEHSVDTVRVHLEERVYTLTQPPAR